MREKKKNKGNFLMYLCFMVLGGLIGIWISERQDIILKEEASLFYKLGGAFLMIFFAYFSIYMQLVIHEAGHLVFGLLSGYRFSSFRIGSLMLLKKKEKFQFCRISIAGTGGQCLMCPPDLKDGKMPFVLYNLGGSFMNLISVFLLIGMFHHRM